MNKIPKIAYFYWGAPVLPYLRYMCLKSFIQYNPDWQVILIVPAELTTGVTWGTHENEEPINTTDYMDRLQDLNIDVRPFSMEPIGFSDDLPEVVKSDLIRLYLLSTTGGLWSDNDILYIKPLSNTLQETNCTSYFCYRRGGVTQDDTPKNGCLYHSIGFLMSEPEGLEFKNLFAGAANIINTELYQSVGSPYYGQMVNMDNPNIFNIDINMVYPSRAPQSMFESPAGHHIYEIRNLTIGWHWYGGHPTAGKFQNLMTETTYPKYDNVISHCLRLING
jgi:hypothetical protein